MPVNVQCPGCRKMCQVAEQQLSQTVFCGECGLMFTPRAAMPAPRPPSSQGVPRPTPLPSHSSPGAASTPANPRSTSANDDDILPTWDEAQVNALLAGSASPPQPLSAPVAAPPVPRPAAPPPATKPVPVINIARLDVGAATSSGKVRPRNEDSFLVHHIGWSNKNQGRDVGLFIVADGLGGHQAGDLASGLAIGMIGNSLAPLLTGAMTGQIKEASPAMLAQAIDSAIKNANLAIFHRAQGDASFRGMASTAAVVLVWDGMVQIGHVGDTRVYHFRNGSLAQVTKDQTLVARMVEMGHLTPQQAATHPARNEVAQAVGLHREIEPLAYQLRLAPGDWLIVACDGLHAHVDARNLEQTLRMALPAAAYVAAMLVDMANQGGGSDNITVVAIRCW